MIQIGEVLALGKDRGSGMERSETFIDLEEIESTGLGEEEKHFGCLPGSGLCSWSDGGELEVPNKNKMRVSYVRTVGRETYGVRGMLERAVGWVVLTSRVVLDRHFTSPNPDVFIRNGPDDLKFATLNSEPF